LRKKLAIIGRGTAGSLGAMHFTHFKSSQWDIEWHYDPAIPTQAVGEGAVLQLPDALENCLDFSSRNLPEIDGSIKSGIYKENWGKLGTKFTHDFPNARISYHFNALRLQDYIHNKIKGRIKYVEGNVAHEQIDADFILNCSGKPKDFSQYVMSDYIPVNSVHVTQCYWEAPRFTHTLTIARPYGWVFGIPLLNRCSIGYIYNKDINTLEEVKADVQNIFDQYNLTPSENTNTFAFNSYYRAKNTDGHIVYNGNSSFFLEPLEATSIGSMDYINKLAFDLWDNVGNISAVNQRYEILMQSTELIIMLHYFAGSIYKTPFWDYAMERGNKLISKAVNQTAVKQMFSNALERINLKNKGYIGRLPDEICNSLDYNLLNYSWHARSFAQNIVGLGIEKKIKALTNQKTNIINLQDSKLEKQYTGINNGKNNRSSTHTTRPIGASRD
jgi:hypothetical protein